MSNNWNKQATGKVMSFNFIWQTQIQTYNIHWNDNNKYYYFLSDFECKVCVQRKFGIENFFKVRCALAYEIQSKEVKKQIGYKCKWHAKHTLGLKATRSLSQSFASNEISSALILFQFKNVRWFWAEMAARIRNGLLYVYIIIRLIVWRRATFVIFNIRWNENWIHFEIDRVPLSKTLEALISIKFVCIVCYLHTQNDTIIPIILLLLLFDWINKSFGHSNI